MQDATEHLRRLARRIVDAALERGPHRAAILPGSGGRGDADFYSDIDLPLYVDELPPEEVLPEIRATVGGTDAMRMGGAEEPFLSEEFVLDGVRTEVSFVTVDRAERWLVCATFGSAHHRGSPAPAPASPKQTGRIGLPTRDRKPNPDRRSVSLFRQTATATHFERELAGARPTNAMAYKP
jgi:hypothetical protein